MWQKLSDMILQGDIKALSRCISLVENNEPGYEKLMQLLPYNKGRKIIGLTGPPGAGKSSIVDGLVELYINKGKRVAVVCVDPSSPFNFGALLGDRIRMSAWYTHPGVFIRSVASRGSLGGLSPKIIEITDLIKAAEFDVVIVETVGVGQSEVEISGLADTTILVLMPDSGDEIQTMKAGIMEIADIFVVNKCDKPHADLFVKNLQNTLSFSGSGQHVLIPVIKMVATEKKGTDELVREVEKHQNAHNDPGKKFLLLTDTAYTLIQKNRMKNINRSELERLIRSEYNNGGFNLYQLVDKFLS